MSKGIKHQGRPGRNPSLNEAQLKSVMNQLSAPTDALKNMIVESQMINDQLHKTNKVLTRTLNEMLGEFHDRLSAVEIEQFGEVKGDFSKYVQKEVESVQVSKVSEIIGAKTDEAVDSENAADSGPDNADAPN